MARSLTDEIKLALQQKTLRPSLLFQGTFRTGIINIWTGIGTLDWDGKVWQGVGDFLGVSEIEETNEIKSSGLSVSLSGVKPGNIALVQSELRRNLPGQLWLSLHDEDNAVIPNPRTLFRGRLDNGRIDDAEDGGAVVVTYEHENITLERKKEVRFTDVEQKRLFPNDRGLEGIATLADKVLFWGNRNGSNL